MGGAPSQVWESPILLPSQIEEYRRGVSYRVIYLHRLVIFYIRKGVLPNPSGGYYDQPDRFWDVLALYNSAVDLWDKKKAPKS